MIDKLIDRIVELQNPTCVGLDTAIDYLPKELSAEVKNFQTAAEAILTFNKGIIDAVSDIVPAVKVQIGCYEPYGEHGFKCFRDTVRYAKGKGLFVIADAKRNDVGDVAAFYAKAYLGETIVGESREICVDADFLTVNGYLGSDGIEPFLAESQNTGKGIFVLVKTSNPSGGELQNVMLKNGKMIYEYMGSLVEKWGENTVGENGFSSVGAVVGATYPQEAAILRKEMPHSFFLIPGYGAQGGNAKMIRCCFDNRGLGGIVNNSRGIICAYQKTGEKFASAARSAAIEMKKDLSSTLGKMVK